ncbi:hypothetical protein [Selenomonas sp.]|uniref:hypothetical protein n=1 Tax=Selenomonas sp. TaxID=2053611 RepID=UPI003FA2192D
MKLRKILGIAFAFCTMFAAAAAPQTAGAEPYTYTNKEAGYSIMCPTKPLGVLPASVLQAGEEGSVLVFANEGYRINKAWIIIPDGFAKEDLPDLTKLSQKDEQLLLTKLKENSAYALVDILPITAKTKGVFAVTSKTIMVDTDGDGELDTEATADTQMAVVFLRTEKGRAFKVELIDNPEITAKNVSEFRAGVSTLKDL